MKHRENRQTTCRYCALYPMVCGPAPRRAASGSAKIATAMVMSTDSTTMTAAVWEKIRSARSCFPSPNANAQRVEVPIESRMATPERKLINGRAMLTPAKARSPTPLETKMPSTMV